MSSNINEEFKKGYVAALSDVFHVLMDNMDDEVKEKVLNDLMI